LGLNLSLAAVLWLFSHLDMLNEKQKKLNKK